ncbi:hypothetical protein A7K93_06075 [Candidatus Methylacidiphilum fumarolicum]|uniref:Uncharacterized protein n=1 Tax=Candidatus Methylacidiphilum fumarolicum TaxID=591154 RepID=A0ABN8XGU6_9BACT|nr:hypothetical protein A7K93_06075 [Candidatus Methylacidiphilum fumarolicum]CAI9085779.1 protein of unknown function [Candidatus Methylacidiphilum fumarolicum]
MWVYPSEELQGGTSLCIVMASILVIRTSWHIQPQGKDWKSGDSFVDVVEPAACVAFGEAYP